MLHVVYYFLIFLLVFFFFNFFLSTTNTSILVYGYHSIIITLRAITSVGVNFPSILHQKNYFFYFTHSFLQNTHINLSILHIYPIKYSLFYNFLLFSPSPPLSLSLSLTNPIRNSFNHLSLPHRLSLSQTQSDSLSLSHEPNNNYNPPFHNKITTKHPNNIPFSLS